MYIGFSPSLAIKYVTLLEWMREKEITSKQEQIRYFHVAVSYKREHRNDLLQIVPTIGMHEAYLIHSFTSDTVTAFLTPRTCTLLDLTRLPVDFSSREKCHGIF